MDWLELQFDENNEPISPIFGDRYFSRSSGRSETEYVFLRHNGLPERWRGADTFSIGEIGFGTGLSFFLTLMKWNELRAEMTQGELTFISVEKFPLRPSDIEAILRRQIQMEVPDSFLKSYAQFQPGWNMLVLEDQSVTLELFIGEALEGVSSRPFHVDAWFYDGFAPGRNPDLWRDELYGALAQHSRKGTSIATFTAAGRVRRGLQAVGFDMLKAKGFGRKRDMLFGVYQPQVENEDA